MEPFFQKSPAGRDSAKRADIEKKRVFLLSSESKIHQNVKKECKVKKCPWTIKSSSKSSQLPLLHAVPTKAFETLFDKYN